jgi:hypothetical protein
MSARAFRRPDLRLLQKTEKEGLPTPEAQVRGNKEKN